MHFARQSSSISVAALYAYPIKSCRGQEVTSGVIGARGFQHDRAFLLVDPDGQHIERAEHPRILLIEATIEASNLLLKAPGMMPLCIKYRNAGPRVDVVLWEIPCPAIDQGDTVAEWLSIFLETPCRLVRMADEFQRSGAGYEQLSLVDVAPFLLMSQTSLSDLNTRLAETISMQRFRPNIVLQGAAAYAEDRWKCIRIGSCVFDIVEACGRCMMTTINPENASIGTEPLRTLATYRRGPDGSVLFGQFLAHRQAGTIRVGDTVEILEAV